MRRSLGERLVLGLQQSRADRGRRRRREPPADDANVGVGAVSIIAPGDAHACALASNAVHCWGKNDMGQVGSGTAGSTDLGVTAVVGLFAGTHALVASSDFTCALSSDGRVQCWGTNQQGQLGSVTPQGTSYIAAPTEVEGL